MIEWFPFLCGIAITIAVMSMALLIFIVREFRQDMEVLEKVYARQDKSILGGNLERQRLTEQIAELDAKIAEAIALNSVPTGLYQETRDPETGRLKGLQRMDDGGWIQPGMSAEDVLQKAMEIANVRT